MYCQANLFTHRLHKSPQSMPQVHVNGRAVSTVSCGFKGQHFSESLSDEGK